MLYNECHRAGGRKSIFKASTQLARVNDCAYFICIRHVSLEKSFACQPFSERNVCCIVTDEFDLDKKIEYEGYIQYFEPWKTLFRRYKGVMQQNFNSSGDYGTRNYQSEDLLAFYTEVSFL